MDSANFFGDEPTPSTDKVDRYNRYVLAAEGSDKSYTRATTLSKTLEDTFNLEQWQTRTVAQGIGMRADLAARAAVTPVSNKRDWKEILDQAKVTAASASKANLGTAFHTLHEAVPGMSDEQYAALPHEMRVTYELYRREMARLGITEVLTEATVVNTAIGTAGKLDGLLQLADGRIVVGDRKSGRVVEYPHSPAMQMAIYSNADRIEMPGGWVDMRTAYPELDTTTGIVIHVTIGDETSAKVNVYDIDLIAGWYGALLAAKVRRWRNRKDLLTPFQPEYTSLPKAPVTVGTTHEKIRKTAEKIRKTAGEVLGGLDAMTPQLMSDDQAEKVAQQLAAQGVPDDEIERIINPAPEGFQDNSIVIRVTDPQVFRTFPGQVTEEEFRDNPDAIPPLSTAVREVLAEENANSTAYLPGAPSDVTVHQNVSPAPKGGEGFPIVDANSLNPNAQLEGTYEDIDTLLKVYKTKAALQHAARKVDPSMNVARNRANLARDIATHARWPKMRGDLLGAAADDTSWSPTPEQVEKAKAMAAAGQKSEFPAVTSDSVPPGHAVVAPVETVAENPYAPKSTPTVAPMSAEEDFLMRIAGASEAAHIASLWEEAQGAGVMWSGRLDQAARVKLASL